MKNWNAITKDNKQLSETEINWGKVTDEIKSLSLDNNGQIITLPDNMDKFIQGKTASAIIGSNNTSLESRYIGFIFRNIMVKIRVDEKTNNISIEVEPS